MPPSRSLKRLPGRGSNQFISELPGLEVIRTFNFQLEHTQISKEIASLVNKIPHQLDYNQLFRERTSYQQRLSLLLLLFILHRLEQDQLPSSLPPYHPSQLRLKILHCLILVLKNDVNGWNDTQSPFHYPHVTKVFDRAALNKVLGAPPSLPSSRWSKLANRVKIYDMVPEGTTSVSQEKGTENLPTKDDTPSSPSDRSEMVSPEEIIIASCELAELATDQDFSAHLTLTHPPPPLDYATLFHHRLNHPHHLLHPLSPLNPRWSLLPLSSLPAFHAYRRHHSQPSSSPSPRRNSRRPARSLRRILLKNRFKTAFHRHQELTTTTPSP